MKDNKDWYLSGCIRRLTKKQATRLAGANDEIRQDCDGLYSVYHLTDKPVQQDQRKWNKN